MRHPDFNASRRPGTGGYGSGSGGPGAPGPSPTVVSWSVFTDDSLTPPAPDAHGDHTGEAADRAAAWRAALETAHDVLRCASAGDGVWVRVTRDPTSTSAGAAADLLYLATGSDPDELDALLEQTRHDRARPHR